METTGANPAAPSQADKAGGAAPAPKDEAPMTTTAPTGPISAPRPDASFYPQPELIGPELRAFLRERLREGDEVTIEVGKSSFTGRIFRLMLEEGWIALEHVDGRRKAFMIIEGGKLRTPAGAEIQLPAISGK